MISLGKKLKSLRKLHGASLAAVGEGTGLSISFLSDLEHDRSNPSLESLVSIANYYGLSVVDLVQGVDLGEELENAKLPSGYNDFLQSEQIDLELQLLLLEIGLHAKKSPQTEKDWRKLYFALLVLLGR